uniref:Predicted protein n=1 Tax=Hordeum vulgare subsp. vulgare TaxID=112509 RepID=F2E846_HORVV|nr:predicted protein [Hordeum vulgare subsp. vulgare]
MGLLQPVSTCIFSDLRVNLHLMCIYKSPWKLRPVSCRERNNRRDEPFCCWQWLHGRASLSPSRGLSVYEPQKQPQIPNSGRRSTSGNILQMPGDK